MSVLIQADDLARGIRAADKLTLIASYWRLSEGAGLSKYLSEHIPTSQFCEPAEALADLPSSQSGRNPMPSIHRLERWFRTWGINSECETIVYDEGRGVYAARLWWVLRWAGVQQVRILDGGLAGFESAGYKVIGGPGNLPRVSNIMPTPGAMPTIEITELKSYTGLLIDAREPERYAGRRELFDLKAGHIPGAINISTREVLNEDYTYRSAAEIQEVFAAHGLTPTTDAVVYSGSGNHSAQLLAAMHLAGITQVRHFVGGWSQWSADRSNPVERGK